MARRRGLLERLVDMAHGESFFDKPQPRPGPGRKLRRAMQLRAGEIDIFAPKRKKAKRKNRLPKDWWKR